MVSPCADRNGPAKRESVRSKCCAYSSRIWLADAQKHVNLASSDADIARLYEAPTSLRHKDRAKQSRFACVVLTNQKSDGTEIELPGVQDRTEIPDFDVIDWHEGSVS